MVCRVPIHKRCLNPCWPDRVEHALFGQGEELCGFSGAFWRSACSRCGDFMWRGGNAEKSLGSVFFAEVGVLPPETLEVPGMGLWLCVRRSGV
ncbi:hypothetical protein Taro_003041 [Colocasia esculenta]|uniref:Uncharacterized protein n=1 Tax=Colocasia esculenta TaxID=4460 RepID=A0A843TKH5_COLES|nr:hypothetical protein [Colocasia esculenta]